MSDERERKEKTQTFTERENERNESCRVRGARETERVRDRIIVIHSSANGVEVCGARGGGKH